MNLLSEFDVANKCSKNFIKGRYGNVNIAVHLLNFAIVRAILKMPTLYFSHFILRIPFAVKFSVSVYADLFLNFNLCPLPLVVP